MAIANIVVADATTPTPVNHTFVPIADGNDAKYVNEAGAQTLAGQETIGFSVKRATDGKSANTARLTLWDPVEVLNVNGTYSVDHGSSADTRYNFAQSATLQEKLNVVTMHINAQIAMKSAIASTMPQI